MGEENDAVVAEQTRPPEITDPAPSNGLALAGLALLWLIGMLFAARTTITAQDAAEMEVTSTAYALPGAISASLIAGVAVALAVLALLTRGDRTLSPTVRLIVCTASGLGIGLLGALSIITINIEGSIYAVLGGTIAAAATIGGAIAAVRATQVVSTVCWAALAVFAVGFGLNLFQSPLLEMFGAGDTQASQARAVSWFALAQSVVAGLAAGLVAYGTLRRAGRRNEGTDLRWPLYAVAGAGPGLALLVAEGLTQTAGARVLDLAGKVSEVELAAQDMLSGSRINNALIVMFVGAVTAIIAIGRTLGPPPEDPAAEDGS